MPGKLYTLIFAISLLTAQWISAADNMWVGLRSGPSIPRLSGGNNEVSRGFSTILAPNFGVVAMYELNSHVAIQTELDYSGQGGERKGLQPITIEAGGLPPLQPGQYLYADFRNRSVLNYLELPVMARYQRNFTGRWRYFFQGGPYIGYLLNAEERTRGSSQIFVDKNRTPLTIEGQPLPPVSFYANTDIAGDLQKFN